LATSFRASLLAALLVALLVLAGTGGASAQGLSVTDDGSESLSPDGIQFRVSAQGDQPIVKVRLRYTVLPDGSPASATPFGPLPEFEPATTLSAGLIVGGDEYLAPGTRIDYYWEVEDASGETATSAEATIVYEDVRFDWKSVSDDDVTVHYYSGSEDDARAMLEESHDVLAEMSDLLAATVDFPVNVRIYGSKEDMQPALMRRSEEYESRVTTAGVRVSSDTVLVLGEVSFTTLRHELAHVVTAVAGEGPYSSLPFWLDEGTAVYAQQDAEGFGDAVERAIDRGNVLSVRSLTSTQGDPTKVNLAYGQSWSLVSFLVDEYGEDKFAGLFAEMKSGKTTDAALEAVYGFDQDGLENEWRASVGLPPREGSSGGDELPDATFPPSSDGGSPASDDERGTSAGLLIAIVVGVVAVLGALAFAIVVVRRRYG
jgi:hypothetical protein